MRLSEIAGYFSIVPTLGLLAYMESVDPVSIPLSSGQRLEWTLAANAKASFAIALEQGGYAAVTLEQMDFDVVADVRGPDGRLVESVDESGKGEPEQIVLEPDAAGVYQIVLSAFDAGGGGRYAIHAEAIRSAQEQVEFKRRMAEDQKAASAWAAANALRLNGTDPVTGVEDLKVLAPIVGDARVVLLGEATHGTREFFQLKHRLLEYLVREKGFNVFAIEASQPEAFAINRYVLDGEGDLQKALAGLYFWTWNTEEVYELIRWMRAYNANPAHMRKLKFYGFDMQSPQLAVRHVAEFLERVDRAAAARFRIDFEPVDDSYKVNAFMLHTPAQRARLVPLGTHWLAQFDQARADWVARASAPDWAIARQHARVLGQFAMMQGAGVGEQTGIRARALADNLLWIAEHEGPDARVVGWAHNGHVTLRRFGTRLEVGGHIRAALGKQARVIGFEFAQGSFQAISMGRQGELWPITVGAPKPDSLPAMLAQANLPLAAFDLRELPTSGPVARWFAEPHDQHVIGSVFNDYLRQTFGYESGRVQDDYDALIFVQHTTAARPMPWGRPERGITLRLPANLDFERGAEDEAPSDWTFSRREEGFGYRGLWSSARAHGGRGSALLLRAPGPLYGMSHGTLSQSIDVAPYRGQRLRVSAWMRAEPAPDGGRGHLRVEVVGARSPGAGDPLQNFRNPVTGPEWQQRSIEVEIGPGARLIQFGAVLVGSGRLWIDDVVIESLGPIATPPDPTTTPP